MLKHYFFKYGTCLLTLCLLLIACGVNGQSITSVSFKKDTFTNCDSNTIKVNGNFPNSNYSIDSFTKTGSRPLQFTLYYSSSGFGFPTVVTFTDSIKAGPVSCSNETLTVKSVSSSKPSQTGDKEKKRINFNGCFITACFKPKKDSVCQSTPVPINDQSKADSIAWYLDGQFRTSNKPGFTLKQKGWATVKQVAFDQTTGDTDTAKADIYGFQKPSPDIKPDSICGNKPDTLKISPEFTSYQWRFNEQSVSGNTGKSPVYGNGLHKVIVKDSNGCVGRDSAQVKARVDLRPDTVICPGNTLQLDAGNPGATYTWQDNSKSRTLKVSKADTFFVEVAANSSCRGYDTVVVDQWAKPSLSLHSDTSLCPGDSLLLDATTPGVDSYRWGDGSKQPTLKAGSNDTFYVSVIDTNECRASDSVIVDQYPVPAISLSNNSFCEKDSLILDPGKAASYKWRNGDTTRTTVVKDSGLQMVTAENGFGCVNQDSAYITKIGLPEVNLRPDTSICTGDTITLDAGPEGSAYSWSTGDATQTIPVTEKGLYKVSVTKQICTAKDSFRLQVDSPLDFSLGADTTLCPSDSIVLKGPTNAKAYQWSDGQRTDSLLVGDSLRKFPNPTNVVLTITDSNGCRSSDSLLITPAQKPVFTLNPKDTAICKDGKVTLKAEASSSSASYTYTWSDGSSGNTFPFDTGATDTFSISVQAKNDQGCLANDTAELIVKNCSGISDGQAESLKVYPNPAGGRTKIQWDPELVKIERIQVKTLDGKHVYQTTNPEPVIQLPSIQWKSGTYIITIETNQARITSKLIIR